LNLIIFGRTCQRFLWIYRGHLKSVKILLTHREVIFHFWEGTGRVQHLTHFIRA
jgi:hypothetical protein